MAAMVGFGVVAFAVPATLVRVFIADAGVISEGVHMLRIVTIAWAFGGGLMVVQGAFRGAGYTKQAMALSLLSRWAFRIPVMWLLAYPLGWAATGLWWGYTAAAIAAFVVGAAWFKRGTWKAGILAETPSEANVPPGARVDSTPELESTD